MKVMKLEGARSSGIRKERDALLGTVARIERFMIHDGPGIRSVLFMKGCSLRCMWCSSPQTWNIEREVVWKRQKCIGCDRCIEACPQGAIVIDNGRRSIDRERCDGCGACVDVCPSGALRFDGMVLSLEEAVSMIMRDESFYRKSGGGVTVSGGEPLFQDRFVKAFLRKCRQNGIHTAMETSGFAQWEIFREVLEDVDLLLIDIKHMDPGAHKRFTGQSNELILENISRAAAAAVFEITVRCPVIPGCNDLWKNLRAVARFMRGNGLRQIDVFPFHKLGEHEYDELGIEYPAREIDVAPPEHIEDIKRYFESEGLDISE